jgi:hypothetical protein
MKQGKIELGWQDTEKLKEEGRVLEAFIILVNWIERNMQFPLYYYYVLSKNDETKKKEFLQKFEKMKGKKSRLSHQDLVDILNQGQPQQERTKAWVTITRFWSSNEVWEDFKRILRAISEEFQLMDIEKLIAEISNFREIRGKVVHRLVEDRVTDKEVEEYYEIGKKLNEQIQQLHYKFLHRNQSYQQKV